MWGNSPKNVGTPAKIFQEIVEADGKVEYFLHAAKKTTNEFLGYDSIAYKIFISQYVEIIAKYLFQPSAVWIHLWVLFVIQLYVSVEQMDVLVD